MQFDGRGFKIMVVDSDRTTLEMIQIRLDVAGYHPISARTAEAGLEVLGHTRIDALVLERNLPGIDGMAFLSAIQPLMERRPFPILLVGRALAADDVRQAVQMGVRDALAKPFSGAAVIERVGRMIKKSTAHAAPMRATA
jgi:two-component system catabolic regulation response regulator CreB